MNDKKAYTLRIDERSLAKMKVISDKYKRSINSQMEFLVEECIEEFEKKYGEIKLPEE